MSGIPEALKQKYFTRRQEEALELVGWLKSEDFENMRSLGHKLKGNGAMYNHPELSDLGKTMEDAAKAQDLVTLKTCQEKFSAWIKSHQS